MDHKTEVLNLMMEQPAFIIHKKLLCALGSNPSYFIAYLMDKFFREAPTSDGYVTASIEEVEKEICIKRGRQDSSIRILKKNKYIIMKPKEGSRKRQFKLLFQNFDPDNSYRTVVKNKMGGENRP